VIENISSNGYALLQGTSVMAACRSFEWQVVKAFDCRPKGPLRFKSHLLPYR